MQKLARLLALYIALMPAMVAAQQFPITLPSDTVYGRLGIPGQPGPGQAIPFNVLAAQLEFNVGNIAALEAIVLPPTNNTVYVAGYSTIADGGQGFFEYNAASSAPANGGTIIAPNNGTGRWIRSLPLSTTIPVEWFGANTASADNTAAIQAAANSVTGGGKLLFQNAGYNVTGTVIISNPMTIECPQFINSSTGNINAIGNGNLIFDVRASDVMIAGCYLNRAGAASGDAIHVGSDYTTVTDAQMSASSTTLTSPSQANFTAADVGKDIQCTSAGAGAGPLLATIGSLISPTQVAVSIAASTNASPTTCVYGTRYSNFVLKDSSLINHAVGLLLQDASQYHVNNTYFNDTNPVHINTLTGQAGGASDFSGDIFLAANSSYGVLYNSGSDVRFVNNKFLGGIYNFFMNWNQSAEGNLLIQDSSLENFQTASIFITTPATYERIVITGNSMAGPGATAIATDNNSAATFNDLIIANNTIRTSGSTTTGVSIGKTNQCLITGNQFDLSGNAGTIGVALLSNSNTCLVRNNYYNTAAGTNITNAGTANMVDESQGITFAHLPTGMANGSRQFISDGAPGTSPCTGSSTGATAFMQNGAWTCTGPQTIGSIAGLGSGVATALQTNVGTAGSPVVNGGVLGTPSSGTMTHATGLPISTGLTGAGAGVLTALGNAINGASGLVGFSGALGTPSSGTLTNATGLPIAGVAGGSAGSIIFSNGTNLAQDNTAFYWDDTNKRLCINAGSAGCNFALTVLGVGQWGGTLAGPGIRYEYGTGVNSGTNILGINYNNNAFNSIALSATSNDDFIVATTGAASARVSLASPTYISSGTVPTGTSGSCSASSFTGGPTAGKFTAPTCAAGTIILSALPATPNGYTCAAWDQTTPADTLVQTANSATSATFKATTAASDVVVFKCEGW